ncbi:cupin domain-containing protein [Candidatus Bathyarchaeota archaeon]|nr:MAG: cupin domain-containing protein [Candidatus Bathyarchaeota archaeon]
MVEQRQVVVQNIKEVKEVTLAKHVKATAKSLFGGRKTGSKNMQLFYSRFEVGGETYLHSHEVEAGHFILAGKLQLITDMGEWIVEANTAIFIPPKIQHKFKNIGDSEAHMLSIFSPPEPMYEME